MADNLDKLHARNRVEKVDTDKPLRPLQPLAQLLQRNARCVGGQNRPGFQLRLDACVYLLLEAKCFWYGFNDEVGGRHAFAAQVRDQTIERVADSAAVVAADLSIELGGALDCASNRLRLHVGEADGEPVPCAPRRNVSTHGAGANHVNAFATPRAASKPFEVVAQEEN